MLYHALAWLWLGIMGLSIVFGLVLQGAVEPEHAVAFVVSLPLGLVALALVVSVYRAWSRPKSHHSKLATRPSGRRLP